MPLGMCRVRLTPLCLTGYRYADSTCVLVFSPVLPPSPCFVACSQHYFFNRHSGDSVWEAPDHLAWVRHDSDL